LELNGRLGRNQLAWVLSSPFPFAGIEPDQVDKGSPSYMDLSRYEQLPQRDVFVYFVANIFTS
jgi:hypothetical protein